MENGWKRTFLRLSVIVFGLVIVILILGLVIFPRPELPPVLSEDTCEQYNILFDASSIEQIYGDPESILADPEAFLNQDPAYVQLAQSRTKGGTPFRYESWLKKIENLASMSEDERQRQIPFRLYGLIVTHKGAFCQEIGRRVTGYLPEGTEVGTTIYLTALDDPVPAYTNRQGIIFSLSHPLFRYSSLIHAPTGLSTFYNLALQELHHGGFIEVFKYPSLEEHKENEVVIDMLINLQMEGIGTFIEYGLLETYPSPFEYFLYLVDKEFAVRWYLKQVNGLFAIAQTRPTGDAYEDIYRQIGKVGYRRKGFYIVGGYMSMVIENELGREALVRTITGGYEAFAKTYNAIADEGMKDHYMPDPQVER